MHRTRKIVVCREHLVISQLRTEKIPLKDLELKKYNPILKRVTVHKEIK